MEDLGKVFREFRMSKNYSLKEAAGEACSTSQLSRFELGGVGSSCVTLL